jgi:hypothetical protein
MMVPWRLQKRFFQAGHSTAAPTPSDLQEKKEEKRLSLAAKKERRKPKKGKVNNPPLSVWRDVGESEDEEEHSQGAIGDGCDDDDAADDGDGKADAEPQHADSEGPCEHVVEDGDQLVFQRYCHVYKQGELEDLCSW